MDLETVGATVAATVLSRLVSYPLDTIAVQHASSTRRPLLSVPLRTYYRGVGASILITSPAIALYFTTYRASKAELTPYLGAGTLNYAASGAIAELTSSLLWTPLEVVKARLQISQTSKDGKLLYQLRDIAKKEGVKGFYRGYLMGLGIYIPYNAIMWTVYENVKKLPADLSYPTKVAIGAAASTICVHSFIFPFDLVKTRYQVATSGTVEAVGATSVGRTSDREGIRQIVKNVMRESGKKGFYAGFFPRLMCSFPSSVVMMSVMEYLKPDKPMDAREESFESVI